VRALLAIGVLAGFLTIPAAAASPAGRIVFVRQIGEQSELFSVRPDRSGLKRLTREPDYDHAPVWSPDGRLIASFGAGGIVLRNADGSVVRRIAIPVEGSLDEIRWSPDGRSLSYLVEHCSYEDPRGYVIPPCGDLWVVDSDGRGNRRLLDREVDMLDGDVSYSWSPTGRSLVYEALTNGPSWLAVVDLRSAGQGRIPGTAGSADPAWSPRGRIAFVRRRGLFAVGGDGRRLRRLARGTSLSRPAWSPDGRWVAYLAGERARVGNRWAVLVVRADGRVRRRLGVATEDRKLVWSPDSRYVLWENFAERLLLAQANGRGNARFLTRGFDPDWR
jgi:Tol biopolymer transport system component